MDTTIKALRMMRAVAECGSFSSAAVALGYTQSAVSRQVAALERDVGYVLFERRANGVRLTPSGSVLLRHACVVIDEINAARVELDDAAPDVDVVRLGAYVSAGTLFLPRVIRALRNARPDIRLVTRDGTTPALIRSVRAGTMDLAVISARPPYRSPDEELPALVVETLDETSLVVAAAASGRFSGRDRVSLHELSEVEWITSPAARGEPVLGIWPGLPGQVRVVHTARDWLTKLRLVAADCGVTTVLPGIARIMPEGVTLLRVEDGPQERRRTLVARLPGKPSPQVEAVLATLRAAIW